MRNYITKSSQERAAVSVLVFVTVLTFVAILMGAYLTVTAIQKSQLESNIRIQQIYSKDVGQIDILYEELISKDRQVPICNITYNINNTNIIYNFVFNEPVKNFITDDIKLYSGNYINTIFENDITLSTSSPSYAVNLDANKKYIISFDYKCLVDNQDFEIGLYSDTLTNLPTKVINASETWQHEYYIFTINDLESQFKFLSNIQENNNVILSNIQLFEINNDNILKGEFKSINTSTYTQLAEYDENLMYAIILENNICSDFNDNPNVETIRIIK